MPSFTWNTSSVIIGISTKKKDFDKLLNNSRAIASSTFTFQNKKTFTDGVRIGTVKINKINSYSGSNGIGIDHSFRSGTSGLNIQTYKKIIAILHWNCDVTTIQSATHGISDITKIKRIEGMIINDAGTRIYNILSAETGDTVGAGVSRIDSTKVYLHRVSSPFDSASFSSTSTVRGWLTIEYEV